MSNNNLTKVCPLIRRIPVQGGGFYVFPSAAEDLTLSIENSPLKFRFSKFALLNIPDILNRKNENTLKLRAIPGAFNSVNFNRTVDNNVHFIESFQNYCMNLETMIISHPDYNYQNPQTISERVFFKWLKELSGLRFEEATSTTLDDVRFKEEDESEFYNKVVQYIGDIDFVNNLKGTVNNYTEVYVHVPTEVGNTPTVLFKSVQDENYQPGSTYCRFNEGLNNEIIAGRKYTDIHPDNLDIHAFYDNDSGILETDGETTLTEYDQITGIELYKKKDGLPETQDDILTDYVKNSWWYIRTSDANCYHLEASEFTNTKNETLAIFSDTGYGQGVNIEESALKFKRSKLDGISIDFDADSYSGYNPDINIKSLMDLARDPISKNFEFNAVLIYYDLYNENGEVQNTVATNLFGILFLDNVEPSSLGGGYIPRFEKCKPNSVLNLNGNSYGFTVNMKLNVNNIISGVDVQTSISDSNTLSMTIYAEALQELFRVSQSLTDINISLLKMDQRLRVLEQLSFLSNNKNIESILNRLNNIDNKLLDENILSFVKDREDILSLISNLQGAVNDILTGDTNYLLESSNSVNNEQNFNYLDKNIIKSSDWNIITGLNPNEKFLTKEVELTELTTYVRFDDLNSIEEFIPPHSLKLYIKDNRVRWSKGKTIRLYWNTMYNLKGTTKEKDLFIYTDFNNQLNKSENYSVLITKIPHIKFLHSRFMPVIEIHCIDPVNLKFYVDILN